MNTSDAPRIALLGDRDDSVTAHRAIGASLEILRSDGCVFENTWVAPATVGDGADLSHFDGVWCIPGTPYSSTKGALVGIGYARQRGLPFLGTCGGFQHALVEYAREVLGIREAAHEEVDPDADHLIVSRLSCSLVEVKGTIQLEPASTIAHLTGKQELEEGYHCNFGLNTEYAAAFENSAFQVVGRDGSGDVRAMELQGHPFFIATLFQPERRALEGEVHPIVAGFVGAVVERTEVARSK